MPFFSPRTWCRSKTDDGCNWLITVCHRSTFPSLWENCFSGEVRNIDLVAPGLETSMWVCAKVQAWSVGCLGCAPGSHCTWGFGCSLHPVEFISWGLGLHTPINVEVSAVELFSRYLPGTNAWTAYRSPFTFTMLQISTELGREFVKCWQTGQCCRMARTWSTFLTTKSFLGSPPWMSRLKWLALIVGLGLIEPSALFIKLLPYRQQTLLCQSLASPWERHNWVVFSGGPVNGS